MFLRKSIAAFAAVSFILGSAFSQSVETVVQAGHYGSVTTVAFSYDGIFIATGSSDKTIILWRSSDGKQIRSFRGSGSAITHVEFNRQGTMLLSLNRDGILITWDISNGKILNRIKPEGDIITCAALHPDGTKIVTGSEKSWLSVWDSNTGSKISDIKAEAVELKHWGKFDYPESKTVKYSNDGKYILAGAADYTAILWDAASGREIHKYKKTDSWCTSCLVEAAISPDNRYIIISHSDSLKIFNRETGALVRELYGQGGYPEDITVSADSRYVAAFEYGEGKVWEIASGKLVLKAGNFKENKVLAAAISPDGKYLVTGGEKRIAEITAIPEGDRIITLRGYLNQVDERILTHSYMYWAALVNEARLSPDGKYIAVGRTGNNAKIIDFRTGKVYHTLKGHEAMVISLAFSRDGKLLATGGLDGKAIVWDVETGKIIRSMDFTYKNLAVFSVDISDDGKMLATADWGGYVFIWDIETGKIIRVVSPHDKTAVYQVKFSPNGVYFISAGLDRKLKLIEIDTGEEIRIFTGHTDLVSSISLNPEGNKIITSGWDGTIRVWDFMSGLQITRIRAHNGGVYCAKYDPSGKYIVSGGDDFLVKQWNASTGELLCEMAGHQGGVGDVNITEDLKYIISGSRDGSVRIWNVPEKRELVSMVFLNENDWFIRNPGGYFDASEGAFKSISFARGTELYSIEQFFNEFYRPGLYNEVFTEKSSMLRQNLNQTIEKFPPPDVEFVLPENGTTSDNQAITCMVKITNNGGGVKELRVLHNGKRQIVDASDLNRMGREGQSVMKTFELGLVPGENEIMVSAYSNGDIESPPQSIKIKYSGIQKTADCWLLSVGINKYENENLNLTYAKPDAQAFSSFVSSRGEKLFGKIHSYSLLDKDATKAKILTTIDNIGRMMKKEDVFIFFYAGHGSTAGNVFYFITTEVTGLYQQEKLSEALRVNELQERFKMLPALKQVIFIDACHSGGSVEVLAMRGATEEKALAQLSRSSGVHVMASSESDQQSAEVKSLGHGVFTYVLLEALSGKADGAPADSKVTVYELKSYVDDQVPEVSYNLIRHKQFPSTFSIGHDFPLVME